MVYLEEEDASFILPSSSLCKLSVQLHNLNHENKDQSPELFKRFTAAFIEINVLETTESGNCTKAIKFA